MSSAVLTSPPTDAEQLVVDTDVASYIFKWHPEKAAPYASLVRGYELVISFMTMAEMRRGALDANWGAKKQGLLEEYLNDFTLLHSDDRLCSIWAEVASESRRKGRPMESTDAWIAATALLISAPLVTNNVTDYNHLDELTIVTA